MSCLGRPDTLERGTEPWHQRRRRPVSSSSTVVDRQLQLSSAPARRASSGGGGEADARRRPVVSLAPLQVLADQNRLIQVSLAKSFWRGVGDIKVSIRRQTNITYKLF